MKKEIKNLPPTSLAVALLTSKKLSGPLNMMFLSREFPTFYLFQAQLSNLEYHVINNLKLKIPVVSFWCDRDSIFTMGVVRVSTSK